MKNKFIRSTIILILGGGITKLLAMGIKIFLTRIIGDEGIGLYMIVLPTFNLFITLCTLSLSTAVSKLIAEKGQGRKIILPLIPFSLIYNLILMIVLILLAPSIADRLLNNSMAYYPIMGISFTLPFICISNILKGYFYGKERMGPYVISNIVEQIVRLLLIIFIIPKLLVFGIDKAVLGVVLFNVVSEFSSIVCLLLFMPKNKINARDFKYQDGVMKDVLNISLSATGSRLIGSISYFLEPVILTFVLTMVGYDNDFIVREYGIITGYVYPLLLIPSFFTMAISTSLLPVIANNYSRGNYSYTKKKLKQALVISVIIGVVFTGVVMIIPGPLLKIIYNTTLGEKYIMTVAPFFLLHYIQGPLTSYLQAVDKSKEAMIGTLFGAIIKNLLLLVLPFFLGIWGFVVASVVNIIYVSVQHAYYAKKSLSKNKKEIQTIL